MLHVFEAVKVVKVKNSKCNAKALDGLGFAIKLSACYLCILLLASYRDLLADKDMSYVTVSVKIPKWLKGLLDKYGIKPDPVVRKALEEEVKRLASIPYK